MQPLVVAIVAVLALVCSQRPAYAAPRLGHTAPSPTGVQMRVIPLLHPIPMPVGATYLSPVQGMYPVLAPHEVMPPKPEPPPKPTPIKLEAEPAEEGGNLDMTEAVAAMKLHRVAEDAGDWRRTELFRIWLHYSDGSEQRVGIAQCPVQSFEDRGDPRSCRATFWTFNAVACGLATTPQLPATQLAWVVVCLSLTAAGSYDIDRICPPQPPPMLRRSPEQSIGPSCSPSPSASCSSSWSNELVRIVDPFVSDLLDGNGEIISGGLGGGAKGRGNGGDEDDRREIRGGGCGPDCGGFTGGGSGGGLFGGF